MDKAKLEQILAKQIEGCAFPVLVKPRSFYVWLDSFSSKEHEHLGKVAGSLCMRNQFDINVPPLPRIFIYIAEDVVIEKQIAILFHELGHYYALQTGRALGTWEMEYAAYFYQLRRCIDLQIIPSLQWTIEGIQGVIDRGSYPDRYKVACRKIKTESIWEEANALLGLNNFLSDKLPADMDKSKVLSVVADTHLS